MPLLCILCPALKSILVNRLQKVFDFSGKLQYSVELLNFAVQEFPLNQVQNSDRICYVSAIAFRLAKLRQESAQDIARTITHALQQDGSRPWTEIEPEAFNRIQQSFAIQFADPGWIYFKLTHQGLVEWLQILVDYLPKWNNHFFTNLSLPHPQCSEAPPIHQSLQAFEALYTHARCCSLLRLGTQAGLIQLIQPDVDSARGWQIVFPNPLPWVIDQQFWPEQAADRRLVDQIVKTLDSLSAFTSPTAGSQLWKLVLTLSQAFQSFYASCQIFGETRTNEPALSQMRLGLVSIVQTLLHQLITSGLGLDAPIEL